MRSLAIVLLIVALGGCTSVRKGLGMYQQAADKGVGFNLPPDGPDAPTVASRDKNALPEGLGGDKAHAAYTSAPQR